jgi:hypothetical protein
MESQIEKSASNLEILFFTRRQQSKMLLAYGGAGVEVNLSKITAYFRGKLNRYGF